MIETIISGITNLGVQGILPIVWTAIIGVGGMHLVNERKNRKTHKLVIALEESFKGVEKEHQQELKNLSKTYEKELDKERKLNRERTKEEIKDRRDSKTVDKNRDIDFCQNLMHKNYERYKNDPTTIDLTLEALSYDRLLAMKSVVSKHPNDEVSKEILHKTNTLISKGAR